MAPPSRIRVIGRLLVVIWQFLPLAVAYARDRRRFLLFGGRRRAGPETQARRAAELLDTLVTLGPTFVKLGQLLSARPDVVPPAYVDALSALQDDVPPAAWVDAEAVVEADLGPVDDRFEAFDTEAISGASLGQVYRARLDGEAVAVKVRRPGVESLVATDLQVIRWFMPLLLAVVDDARAFSLENLAEEFAKTIREEMDYEREARMLREIRANFEDDDRYVIPRVLEDHSIGRVLTMTYVGGTKITDVEALDRRGLDRERLAADLQRAYMGMIIEDGVFHADPHPGNLAVTDDGRIVIYDFGMSGRVDSVVQEQIVDFYLAVANRDIDAILDTLVAIGTLSPEADRGVMAEVMELAIENARGRDVETYRVQQIVGQVEGSLYAFPFRLPRNLALVLRVATVVEGVCITLDRDYDFIETATTFLTERGYREASIRAALDEAGRDVGRSVASLTRIAPKTERALDRLDRDALGVRVVLEDDDRLFERLARRLIYGMLLTMGLFSAAVLYALDAPAGAVVALAFSVTVALLLVRSFRRRRSTVRPRFPRQELDRWDRDGDRQ